MQRKEGLSCIFAAGQMERENRQAQPPLQRSPACLSGEFANFLAWPFHLNGLIGEPK